MWCGTHCLLGTYGYTHTLRICNNNYCFPTATLVAPTRFSVTLYVHCLACLFLQSADLQFFDPLQQTPTKQPLQGNQHEHEKKVLHTQVSILSPTSKFHLFLSLKTGIVNICNETHILWTVCCQSNLSCISKPLLRCYQISSTLAQEVSETGVMDSRMLWMCVALFCPAVDDPAWSGSGSVHSVWWVCAVLIHRDRNYRAEENWCRHNMTQESVHECNFAILTVLKISGDQQLVAFFVTPSRKFPVWQLHRWRNTPAKIITHHFWRRKCFFRGGYPFQ